MADDLRIEGPRRLAGRIKMPADKSILHRALILGAMAHGDSIITAASVGRDCASTRAALRALGVPIEDAASSEAGGFTAIRIRGQGPEGWREPQQVLNCGNSGTTMRLLLGALAGRPFHAVLTGDASLRKRPMGRVVTPLLLMGAKVNGRSNNTHAPLSIRGGALHGLRYPSPVASAQVKSAVLLAGIQAEGETAVEEPVPSRDHTERMLRVMGVNVRAGSGFAAVNGPARLSPIELSVPGDISGAAFLLTAAAASPGSEVVVEEVGLNPGRIGFLETLRRMGADVAWTVEREVGGEPVGTVVARGGALHGTTIGPLEVPALIDELPVLAVAASCAEGVTRVEGAAELRHKESDRIHAMATELRRMGVRIQEFPDGFEIAGPAALRGAEVRSHGDHRLAMALAVAATLARGESRIARIACADVSFPGFAGELARLAG